MECVPRSVCSILPRADVLSEGREGSNIYIYICLLNAEYRLFLNITFPMGNKFILRVALPPCIPHFGRSSYYAVPMYFFTKQIMSLFCSCSLLHQFSAASPPLSFYFTLTLSTGVSASLFSIGLRFFRPWRQTAKHGPHSSFISPFPRATLTRIWSLYTRVSIPSTPYINPVGLSPLLKQ